MMMRDMVQMMTMNNMVQSKIMMITVLLIKVSVNFELRAIMRRIDTPLITAEGGGPVQEHNLIYFPSFSIQSRFNMPGR